MTALNSTQLASSFNLHAHMEKPTFTPELEKISCSFYDGSQVHPVNLVGKRLKVSERTISYLTSVPIKQDLVYSCHVVAVQIGHPDYGIETSFLIREEGSDYFEFRDISALTILEILN